MDQKKETPMSTPDVVNNGQQISPNANPADMADQLVRAGFVGVLNEAGGTYMPPPSVPSGYQELDKLDKVQLTTGDVTTNSPYTGRSYRRPANLVTSSIYSLARQRYQLPHEILYKGMSVRLPQAKLEAETNNRDQRLLDSFRQYLRQWLHPDFADKTPAEQAVMIYCERCAERDAVEELRKIAERFDKARADLKILIEALTARGQARNTILSIAWEAVLVEAGNHVGSFGAAYRLGPRASLAALALVNLAHSWIHLPDCRVRCRAEPFTKTDKDNPQMWTYAPDDMHEMADLEELARLLSLGALMARAVLEKGIVGQEKTHGKTKRRDLARVGMCMSFKKLGKGWLDMVRELARHAKPQHLNDYYRLGSTKLKDRVRMAWKADMMNAPVGGISI